MTNQFEGSQYDLNDLFQSASNLSKYWPLLLPGIVALLLLLMLPSMVFQIDRDERGVVLRFGRLTREVAPGLGMKFPYPLESLHKVNTERVFRESFGYRPDGVASPAGNQLQESLILTGDLGVARVQWDVLYRRTDPARFLFNIRDEEKLIRLASQAALRSIIGDYDVVPAVTDARREIARKTREEMQRLMNNYNSGITITDVYIQQSEPPAPVAPAFRRVNSARQLREEMRHEAERERERVINEAQGEVDRLVSEAHGDSAAIINRALGESQRFLALLAEYRQAPRVTRQRLFLETLEGVLAESTEVYLIDEKVRGLLPHLNIRGAE